MGLPYTLILFLAAAQAVAAPRTFDVASIKPNLAGGDARRASASPGGGFTASNVSLRLLISRAYGVGEGEIEGGPSWVATETWDVSARVSSPTTMTTKQLQECLQALLAERFQLRIHRQTKQGPVLSLVVARKGHKLKEHVGGGTPAISASSESGRVSIAGIKMTMTRLAEYLTAQAKRPVVDNTGLTNEYDFHLEWAADETASQGVSLFTALEEQIGLKLEATKGPVEAIVIDGATRASAD